MPTVHPDHSPTPTPVYRCEISGNKRVSGPEQIVLGQTSEIELSLHANCPPNVSVQGADIVIVIDRSEACGG